MKRLVHCGLTLDTRAPSAMTQIILQDPHSCFAFDDTGKGSWSLILCADGVAVSWGYLGTHMESIGGDMITRGMYLPGGRPWGEI